MQPAAHLALLLLLVFSCGPWSQVPGSAQAAEPPSGRGGQGQLPPVLVVGSLNIDIIVPIRELPRRSETGMATAASASLAVGGKGSNQAVAAARLSAGTNRSQARFVCRFGDDSHGTWLRRKLEDTGLDLSLSAEVPNVGSGTGIVWLDQEGGATSVVLGGANTEGWSSSTPELQQQAQQAVAGAAVLLLQREIPEHVNEVFAAAAAARGMPVMLDAGGEIKPLSRKLAEAVDYFCPNEQELGRLTGMPTGTDGQALAAALVLLGQYAGAGVRNVLVTLEARGSMLLVGDGAGGVRQVLRQPALPVPGGVVVDATAAGDAFRAAFAIALVEGRGLEDALRFAAAAGAIAVSRMGAMPSLPTRQEVETLLQNVPSGDAAAYQMDVSDIGHQKQQQLPGGHQSSVAASTSASPEPGTCSSNSSNDSETSKEATCGGFGARMAALHPQAVASPCPLLFASRLNSMSQRRDLAAEPDGSSDKDNNVLGWVARQGLVGSLDVVYFNHPQHLEGLTPGEVRDALAAAGLRAGGINTRFPGEFRAGALSSPDPVLWSKAVQMGVEGCRWASELGAQQLVVWSPSDGYDYHFQADYLTAWHRVVQGLRELSDACGPLGVQVSLEWKPTDESSRFSFVPSTAAALLMAQQVDRPNFGLTLDTGHLLMGGENAAQSVAMVAAAGKLFGMHLNDGYSRLGAEDGLMFGSVHATGALELVYWLRKLNYSGHIYFDTFPLNEDPVREARANVRRFRSMWEVAGRLLGSRGLEQVLSKQDALAALELLEDMQSHAL